jgi:hypothetical protein
VPYPFRSLYFLRNQTESRNKERKLKEREGKEMQASLARKKKSSLFFLSSLALLTVKNL